MSDTALWPQQLDIVGVTGEYASGKTLFGLTIDPKNTRLYDTEKSAGSYHQALGVNRISMPDEMLKAYPNGYKPIDTFEWWHKHVRGTAPGQFRVIVIDTISEIESGLVDWVQKNPGHFGRTASQYQKMSGLLWGDVKEHWKAILSDIAARCETFVFVAHMTNVWNADRPSGKRKPKGKETLMELASLYLELERKPDEKGKMPTAPSAKVLKSRLSSFLFEDDGVTLKEIVPTLPPRIPVATPKAIREYMLKPPDYKNLKKEEKVQVETMTDEERLRYQATIESDRRDAEQAKLLYLEKVQEMQEKQKAAASHTANQNAAQQLKAEAAEGAAASGMSVPASSTPAVEKATEAQRSKLKSMRDQLYAGGMTTDVFTAAMLSFGITKASEMTSAQAIDMIRFAEKKLGEMEDADANAEPVTE